MERLSLYVPLGAQEFGLLALLALIAILPVYVSPAREPTASAETRFVELSASGLQIVPASCPSSPHVADECSPPDPPIPAPSTGCGILASAVPERGPGVVEVSWESWLLGTSGYGEAQRAGYTHSGSITGIGSVPFAGRRWINTGLTTFTYTGAYEVHGATYPFSCSVTLSGSGGTDVCPNDPGVQSTGPCSQCTPQNICGSGANSKKVVNSCSGAVIEDCAARGPGWFCSGGQCAPEPADGNITVNPSLVRSGDRTQVSWTTTNMLNCSVTENNPTISDFWPNVLSGVFASSPIRQRTTYTLSCTKNDGALFTDTATVNIIPTFIEL